MAEPKNKPPNMRFYLSKTSVNAEATGTFAVGAVAAVLLALAALIYSLV